MTRSSTSTLGNIRPILGAIRSVPVPSRPSGFEPTPHAAPFITISRQPGAGGWALAQLLVDALNESMPGEQLWTCWDRELVEKVAGDHHLSTQLIDSLEDRGHSWLSDFLESLSFSDSAGQADESKIYSRVAATIRALAQAGRVVIVGRGGVFVTHRMPGGIHVRLVAPYETRVAFMAETYQLTHDKAVARVKELEYNRQAFYRRYWPHESLGSETFALTINTAHVEQTTMLQLLQTLVRQTIGAEKR